MIVFRYDKTWEGLLTCLFRAYAAKVFPDVLLGPDDMAPVLAGACQQIQTQRAMAGRVMNGLKRQLSPLALRQLMYAWLAEERRADEMVFAYMRKVFDSRGRVASNFSDPAVIALRGLWQKTSKAIMHVKQFVRFQKTSEDIYFAVIEPDCNVLPLTLDHFVRRFAGQPWILYDGRRHYGFYYDREKIREMSLSAEALASGGELRRELLAEDEKLLQQAWRQYYKTLSIKERANPRLHRQNVLRRFWRHLTEKQ